MKENSVIKFKDFIKINENIHDTPEEYIKMALTKIKNKIEKMFDGEVKAEDIEKIGDRKKREEGISLSDEGIELQSIELSRYSKVQDSVKVIYSDAEARYDLTIIIDLKDGVPTSDDKDFSDKDIKKCYIKFKKYDNDNFNLIGEISKTINIDEINDDFIISLKIDFDKEFGSENEEEFDIETED
jgi:hypothetical protein